jgi:hypothetical protein
MVRGLSFDGNAGVNARPLPWLAALLGRRRVNVVAAALANKNARVAWALLTRGQVYAANRQGRWLGARPASARKKGSVDQKVVL